MKPSFAELLISAKELSCLHDVVRMIEFLVSWLNISKNQRLVNLHAWNNALRLLQDPLPETYRSSFFTLWQNLGC
jgi:hypothetical protein